MKALNFERIALAYTPTYINGRNDIEEITRNTPTLRVATSFYGREVVRAWLVVHLNDLNDFCGKRIKMDVAQMLQTADVILDTYPSMTLTQYLVFFRRFKAGKYGEFYAEIDPMRITSAFRQFWTERGNIIAKYGEDEQVRERKLLDEKRRYEWEVSRNVK